MDNKAAPKTATARQVSYSLPHFRNVEIRRAGEQTSPQVARAAGHPRSAGRGGGSNSGSSSIRRFQSRLLAIRVESLDDTFRGESLNKVDSKGRVSIPAPFRRVLEQGDPNWRPKTNPEFVIVYGGASRDYLEIFTIKAISEVDAKIAKMPRGSKKRKALQRLYSGQALPSNSDETGRIVLPAKLREKIGIENEAFFIGNGDTFEIWQPATYDAQIDVGLEGEDDFDPSLDPSVYLEGDFD